MAQLPPKVPNMTQNWPDISHHRHQRMPSLDGLLTTPNMSNPTAANATQAPPLIWVVDEFLDFSSSKRGSHRRSISDSVAFLEDRGPGGSSSKSTNGGSGSTAEFDRFDEEQFMSMFNDDAGPTMSCSSPSSPASDHNSINDDKQAPPFDQQIMMQQLRSSTEAEEEDSLCNSDGQVISLHANLDGSNDKIFDPKRIKRILANRQSAQRSRVRKLQYISELERTVNSLQAEVSVLSPRVSYLDHQRLVLNVDNSVLKQRIAALSQDKLFKDAHQDALKKEIDRLKQVYYQQNLKKMENGTSPPPSKLQSPIPDAHGFAQKVAI